MASFVEEVVQELALGERQQRKRIKAHRGHETSDNRGEQPEAKCWALAAVLPLTTALNCGRPLHSTPQANDILAFYSILCVVLQRKAD